MIISSCIRAEAATGCALLKKVFLKISQNSLGNTCARVSFLIMLYAWGLTLAHVFSYEFYEIFKNAFNAEHLRAALIFQT